MGNLSLASILEVQVGRRLMNKKVKEALNYWSIPALIVVIMLLMFGDV